MLLKNYDWQSCFKSGQETLDNKPRSRDFQLLWVLKQFQKFTGAGASQPADNHKWACEWNRNLIRISMDNADRTTDEMRWTRWMLNHNNATSHTAMTVQQFLAGKQTAIWLQPPRSGRCDFWLFPAVKNGALGSTFCNTWRKHKQFNSRPAHYTKGGSPWVVGTIKTVAASVRVHRQDLLQGSSDRKACTSTYTLRECGFCWCDTTFNILFFAKMVYI